MNTIAKPETTYKVVKSGFNDIIGSLDIIQYNKGVAFKITRRYSKTISEAIDNFKNSTMKFENLTAYQKGIYSSLPAIFEFDDISTVQEDYPELFL